MNTHSHKYERPTGMEENSLYEAFGLLEGSLHGINNVL